MQKKRIPSTPGELEGSSKEFLASIRALGSNAAQASHVSQAINCAIAAIEPQAAARSWTRTTCPAPTAVCSRGGPELLI